MTKDIQAFPVPDSHFEQGMTLRDYFAAKAMQAYLTADETGWDFYELASSAYTMADAMLKERSDE